MDKIAKLDAEIEALQKQLQDSKTNEQYYYNLWGGGQQKSES